MRTYVFISVFGIGFFLNTNVSSGQSPDNLLNSTTRIKDTLIGEIIKLPSLERLAEDAKSRYFSLGTFRNNKLPAFNQPTIQYQGGLLDLNGSADTSFLNHNYYYLGAVNAISSWLIAGIPISVSGQELTNSEDPRFPGPILRVHFDKGKYLADLKKKVLDRMGPESILQLIQNPLKEAIQKEKSMIFSDFQAISNKCKGSLNKEIKELEGIPSIIELDAKSLRDKYLNQAIVKQASDARALLNSLQNKLNNGESIDSVLYDKLNTQVLKFDGSVELVRKYEEYKEKWKKSGLLQLLGRFNALQSQAFQKILSDPQFLSKVVKGGMSLKGIQRFFLSVSRFDGGKNSLSISPFTFQHYLSNGINLGIEGAKKNILFIAGKQKTLNSYLDFPFSKTPRSEDGTVKAFSLGTSAGKGFKTDVLISSFNQSVGSSGYFGMAGTNTGTMRKILVTSILNNLSFGENGLFTVELSRSAIQYEKHNSLGDSGLAYVTNISKVVSSSNLPNLAIRVNYSEDNSEKGLNYSVNFAKTSQGYVNPGSSNLESGNTEFGTNLRKKFIKNKLVFQLRTKDKIIQLGEGSLWKWHYSNYLFDLKWKIDRTHSVSIHYQPTKMKNLRSGALFNQNRSFTADATLLKRKGKMLMQNFVSLSSQKSLYMVSGLPNDKVETNSVIFSSTQNISIGDKGFYTNLNYNYTGRSMIFYLNSSLQSEIGAFYKISQFNFTTGLYYSDFKDWYSQVGIRQSCGGVIGKVFSLHIECAISKKLQVIKPSFSNILVGDISVRYLIGHTKSAK